MKEQIIAILKEYVKVVLVEDQLCGSDYPAITHKFHNELQGYDKAADEILELFIKTLPTITDEEIEEHFTTPHYHYEKGHYYKIRKDRIFGAKWMRDEIRKRMGKKFDGNKSVDETMPTGPRFLSPSPLEREWQEHCLKMMFPDYPNVCSWQVLNSLIINASRGTELGIPEYDDWFRNRMINDCL